MKHEMPASYDAWKLAAPPETTEEPEPETTLKMEATDKELETIFDDF